MEKGQRVSVVVGGERQLGWFVCSLWGDRAAVVFEVLMQSPRYSMTVVPLEMIEEVEP
jgi:hypothetical protein